MNANYMIRPYKADLIIHGRLPEKQWIERVLGPFHYLNIQLLPKQEPLGREFEEVLYDNLWDMMVHT